MRRLHGCLSCAALLPPLLAVLAALAPHPAAAEAAALEGHDFLPFRAPGGCTDFLLSYNPELPYSQQVRRHTAIRLAGAHSRLQAPVSLALCWLAANYSVLPHRGR